MTRWFRKEIITRMYTPQEMETFEDRYKAAKLVSIGRTAAKVCEEKKINLFEKGRLMLAGKSIS